MEIFKAFGLDWRVLTAQFVNFAILFFILYKFAYKPMFKVLEDRKKRIEDGIENAIRAENKLKEISEEEKSVLREAKKEAAKILEDARAVSEENKKKAVEKAKEEIGALINQEKENMRLEKAETLREIKNEIGDLVAAVVEKVLEEKMDKAKDAELIKKTIGKLK